MRLALLLALLSGCTFARIRYHDGAERAAALECFPEEEEPSALACWPALELRARARERSYRL